MIPDIETRLVRIETDIAGNERAIGELSDMMRDCVRRLDLLSKELTALGHEHAQLRSALGALTTESTH